MDKNPATLDIAIQYMKTAITNKKIILGARKCKARISKFEGSESEIETSEEMSSAVRATYSNNNTKQTPVHNTEQTKVSELEIRVNKIEDNREIKCSIQNKSSIPRINSTGLGRTI
jgi:hypothetical protein